MKPGDARPGFTSGELEILGDHARRDWRDAIRQTDKPILFVAGADSEVWPSTHAAASAALNPRATSAVIANDGHAANIEQPHRFNALMLEFLAES